MFGKKLVSDCMWWGKGAGPVKIWGDSEFETSGDPIHRDSLKNQNKISKKQQAPGKKGVWFSITRLSILNVQSSTTTTKLWEKKKESKRTVRYH